MCSRPISAKRCSGFLRSVRRWSRRAVRKFFTSCAACMVLDSMPLLTDLRRIQTLLDEDRGWSAYAIGDLSPEHVQHCSWYVSEGRPPAVVLLYRGFTPPI